MSNPIKERSALNTKLNIRPIFFNTAHELAYEGPCRFNSRETMTPEFEKMMSNESERSVMEGIKKNLDPDKYEILETHRFNSYSDTWAISEDDMKALCSGSEETDLYIVSPGMAAGEVIKEFALRVQKPIILISNDVGISMYRTSLRARGCEVYSFLCWEDAKKTLNVLRARKILAETTVMCVTRFNGTLSEQSAADSFINLENVTKVLGTHFRMINIHEFIDQLEEIDPTTNHTLPGRPMNNINAGDMAEIEKIADELIGGAKECRMEKKHVITSLKAYKLIQKLLERYDCNAFTMPCPDACSTCRLNKEQFTVCLAHSLNIEGGIPSACEYDISAALSQAALHAVSGHPSYMGNTNVISRPEGGSVNDFMGNFAAMVVGREGWEELTKQPNLVATGHSVPNRYMHGYDSEPTEYSIAPFAYSGFGATLRHDFKADAGQVITMCRFTPNCDGILIARGKIVYGYGYDTVNCTLGVVFEVSDSRDFFEKQAFSGNHTPLVYGDYVDDMILLAKSLGIKPIVCA